MPFTQDARSVQIAHQVNILLLAQMLNELFVVGLIAVVC